jgi:alkylation response protein AidB-like acyl-CoA dehydrogenase
MSEEAAFEQRAVEWSNAHPPPVSAPSGSRTPHDEAELAEWSAWTRELHAGGLAVAHWPPRWGGQEAGYAATRAIARVLREAGAPLPLTDVAINLVGPAVMRFGTEAQQTAHLPGIADGSTIWTQLFSEPEAGSDLAALRTRAMPTDGGGWVISGQKVWSTYAHIADWGYLLARTGAQDERHRTLTMFLVPMRAPGITIRPIREITGSEDFNEVFFDGVVLEPDSVLGEVGGGWTVTMGTLSEERRFTGELLLGLEADAGRLARTLAELGDSAAGEHRDELARILGQIAALTALIEADTAAPGADSMIKIAFSELNVELQRLAVDVAASRPDAVPAAWASRWSDNLLFARAYTISGGANELLRGVVAKRALGLRDA